MQKSAQYIATKMKKTEEVIVKKKGGKLEIEKMKHEEDSADEKKVAEQLMCKRTLTSLTNIFALK